MPTYRAQVVIPHTNNLARDAITNTFHFIDFVPFTLQETADAVTPLMDTLYTSIYGPTNRSVTHYNWALTEVNWYDLSQPTPRVPYTKPMAITASSTAGTLPTEVSCVVSFQANREPGVPQSRRRGRIYLGGLGNSWMQTGGVGVSPLLAATPINDAITAFDTFMGAVAGTSARWAVWSPTDQTASIVTNGWIENSPDTQRRRGVSPNVRATWS